MPDGYLLGDKSLGGELAAFGEPINPVLEVDIDGDDVTFTLYDLRRNIR